MDYIWTYWTKPHKGEISHFDIACLGLSTSLVKTHGKAKCIYTDTNDVDRPSARGGTGELGITGASGVTVNSALGYLRLNSQYSGATLIKQGTDTWYVFGDLKS